MRITTINVPLSNTHEFDISLKGRNTAKEFTIAMPGEVTGTIVLHNPSMSYMSLGDLVGGIAVIPATTPLYRSRTLTPAAGAIIITAEALSLGGMEEWTIGDYADDLHYLLSDMDNKTITELSGRKPV